MKHIGLFEGIGGFSLAARWMNWETIAWCEWNEYCQKILKQHFKEAQGHGDITKTDFTIYRGQCGILTGGFPCQPYSQAGKRKGKDDERHLWPEMLRAIGEIQPPYVVGENVLGLLNWNGGLVFDEVQTDLEAQGYEVFPYVLPACATNAPHRRDRVWFIAYSHSNRNRYNGKQDRETNGLQSISGQTIHTGEFIGANTGLNTDTNSIRCNGSKCEHEKYTGKGGKYALNDLKPLGNTANTHNKGLQGGKEYGSIGEIGEVGNEQFTGHIPPTWENFPTQPALCGRDDGISNRVDRIKALGNAIVPQVAYQIFKAIALMEFEMLNCQLGNDMQCGVGKNNI